MTPERWRRVEEVFDAAAAVPEPELYAWLARECGGDTGLLQRSLEVFARIEAEAGREEPGTGLREQIGRVTGNLERIERRLTST